MVHSVHAAVGHGQSAEVNPTAHGVTALVKYPSGFGVKRTKNGVVGILASLLVGQQLLALIDDDVLPADLRRILAGRERKDNAVGDGDGFRNVKVAGNPGGIECRLLRRRTRLPV